MWRRCYPLARWLWRCGWARPVVGLLPDRRGLATPEKALVDFLYLAPARSKLFRALPELELAERFSPRRARAIVARINSARRRAMVSRALDRFLVPRCFSR